jgi:hypothetical protein
MSMAEPKTDDEWQARDDGHTLRRAAEITKDKDRLAKAQKALVQIEKEAQDELAAIQDAKELPGKLYPTMAKDTDKDGK